MGLHLRPGRYGQKYKDILEFYKLLDENLCIVKIYD